MNRRRFLTAALAAPCFAKLSRARLTIIADEAGDRVDDWIAFARSYQLQWLEMRAVIRDGNPVMLDSMRASELKPLARRLASEGLRVSFLNSALLKYTLPGTTPVITEDWYDKLYARLNLTPEALYKTRKERLKRAIEAAQILGADKLRTFTFWRVKEPRRLYPRLVELLGEMGSVAGKEGCRLLVETEYATNVATSEEIRDLLKQLPEKAIGINWDPQNSLSFEPDVFPAGYRKLPKERIWNVQIKAEGLWGKNGNGKLDWGTMLQTLDADGYRGLFGLETHHGHGPENFAMSRRCMDELVRLASAHG